MWSEMKGVWPGGMPGGVGSVLVVEGSDQRMLIIMYS